MLFEISREHNHVLFGVLFSGTAVCVCVRVFVQRNCDFLVARDPKLSKKTDF